MFNFIASFKPSLAFLFTAVFTLGWIVFKPLFMRPLDREPDIEEEKRLAR